MNDFKVEINSNEHKILIKKLSNKYAELELKLIIKELDTNRDIFNQKIIFHDDELSYWFRPSGDINNYIGFVIKIFESDELIFDKKIRLKKRKEIILINSYTDTEDKLDKLRNLIKNIKIQNFEICLITHTSTPQDIVDRCDYFIFDKKNPLTTEPEIQYRNFYRNENYKIRFLSKKAKIHFLAYYRLIFGGLQYLHSMGYEIVHSFDYDITFNSFDEIYDNTEFLETYDLIAYKRKDDTKLTYFSINLNSINFEKMIYDDKIIFEKYKSFFQQNKFPIIENLLFDEFLPQNIYLKNLSNLEDTSDINTERANFDNDDDYDLCLFPYINNFYIFVFNKNHLNIKIEIIINDEIYKKMYVESTSYHLIDEIINIKNIKIYSNNKIYFEYDLKNDLEYIKTYTKFEEFKNNKTI